MFTLESPTEAVAVAIDRSFAAVPKAGLKRAAWDWLIHCCKELDGLGVIAKVERIARIIGVPETLEICADFDLRVMLDLKSTGTMDTLLDEYFSYSLFSPAIITIDDRVKREVFQKLHTMFPYTLVLPFGLATDKTDDDFASEGRHDRATAAKEYFLHAEYLGADGVLCSPRDLRYLPEYQKDRVYTVCPAVKPSWAAEDRNSVNALAPTEAQRAGAHVMVIGRGINDQPSIREATKNVLCLLGLD